MSVVIKTNHILELKKYVDKHLDTAPSSIQLKNQSLSYHCNAYDQQLVYEIILTDYIRLLGVKIPALETPVAKIIWKINDGINDVEFHVNSDSRESTVFHLAEEIAKTLDSDKTLAEEIANTLGLNEYEVNIVMKYKVFESGLRD